MSQRDLAVQLTHVIRVSKRISKTTSRATDGHDTDDRQWDRLDYTPRAVFSVTSGQSATAAPTPLSCRSRAWQTRRRRSSTLESGSPMCTRRSVKFRAQKSVSSGDV